MRQLIAGNWKMNLTRAEAVALAGDVARGASGMACDILICPPFTALDAVAQCIAGSGVLLGGQDCHAARHGAHTGDVAAPMLADLGCRAVILGHSERRQDHGETSRQVHDKARAAAATGLMPIICVGETEAERDAGAAESVVCTQVMESVPAGFTGCLAYEPIWAIGTGRTPTEQDVARMHAAISGALVSHLGAAARGVRILYGGSVKAENAASLLAVDLVGGALVGGASLKAAEFLRIAAASPGG